MLKYVNISEYITSHIGLCQLSPDTLALISTSLKELTLNETP